MMEQAAHKGWNGSRAVGTREQVRQSGETNRTYRVKDAEMESSDDSTTKGWLREILSRDEYGTAFKATEWTESAQPIEESNALWKQYVVFVDLYKLVGESPPDTSLDVKIPL
jgi:hypothetical protein